MILLTVNDKPISEQIAEATKTILPSSTERITRRRVLGSVFKGAGRCDIQNRIRAREPNYV